MTRLPTVSAVMATYQRADRLAVAVEPLLAEPELHELVVVSDGSTDATGDVVRSFAARDARVRLLEIENRGSSRARYAGAQAATGEVVLMLDDDVIAEPGLVAGHARHHAASQGLVVVGYMPIPARKRRPGGYAHELYQRQYERHCAGWEAAPETVLRSLWAGNVSARRADLLRLGDDLELIVRGYHEDLDFGLRLHKLGLVGRFDRTLSASHRHERTAAQFLSDARSAGWSLRQIYQAHGDVLGEMSRYLSSADLPQPARALVAAARNHRWPRRLVAAAVPVFGHARLYRFERFTARMLRRMEEQEGADAFWDGRRVEHPEPS